MIDKSADIVFPDDVNVLAVVKSDKMRQKLLAALDSVAQVSSKVVVGDLKVAQDHIANDRKHSVVLLEVGKKDANAVDDIQKCFDAYHNIEKPFIVISDGLDDKKMVSLVRLGVHDFLSAPLTDTEIRSSIARLAHKFETRQAASAMPANSKIITFVHASGGMGATTLAVNAATIINSVSSKQNQAACLLDLDLQYGGASIHLDLPGYSPVADLVNKPERLDYDMFEGMMMRHNSGLRVLTTPEAPLPVEAINSEIVDNLLRIAQSRFSYTVIDMPQTMTLWTDAVLQKSDVIYVVLQLNVPSIRQLRRWFSVLEQEGLHGLPVKVVVNRNQQFGRMRHDNVSLAQASEALGRKVDFLIPNDYDLISQSLDQGMPAATLRPQSKFVLQIKNMLKDVVDEIDIPQRRGLLSKVSKKKG